MRIFILRAGPVPFLSQTKAKHMIGAHCCWIATVNVFVGEIIVRLWSVAMCELRECIGSCFDVCISQTRVRNRWWLTLDVLCGKVLV